MELGYKALNHQTSFMDSVRDAYWSLQVGEDNWKANALMVCGLTVFGLAYVGVLALAWM